MTLWLAISCLLSAGSVWAQTSAPAAKENDTVVTVGKVAVVGSRLTPDFVQQTTGLVAGGKVNESAVRTVCQRLTKTGLIDDVSYTYQTTVDDPTGVTLQLTIRDTQPLLPATVKIAGVEPDAVWAYLAKLSPVVIAQLPRTEAALTFYGSLIERYLKSVDRNERITAQVTGTAEKPTGIVFSATKAMPAPGKKK